MLEVNELRLSFGGIKAIDGVTFGIEKGEISSLIGPNGAGKTTVFNCLTGFYRGDSGDIIFKDKEGKGWHLDKMSDVEIVKGCGIVRTFQNIRLFSGMSVLENLIVARYNKLIRSSGYSIGGLLHSKRYKSELENSMEMALGWLRKLDLLGSADKEAGSLAYGEQKKLEIARAMCLEPVLLCMDEPAAGLNDKESEELALLVTGLVEDYGMTILLIEHDMNVVMKISEKVVVLDNGKVISSGDVEHVRNDEKVIRAYLGE